MVELDNLKFIKRVWLKISVWEVMMIKLWWFFKINFGLEDTRWKIRVKKLFTSLATN